MTRKKRRLYMIGLALSGLSVAVVLALLAFESNVVFFYSPSDLMARPPGDRALRVGGLVEDGSVEKLEDGLTVRFRITDNAATIPVSYRGIVPDLFREGQGVVAEGRLRPDGVFEARDLLARHDENYMPREVADTLKRQGHWQGEANASPPTQ